MVGQGIFKVTSNNADYTYIGECIESGHCSRYYSWRLVLILFLILFIFQGHLSKIISQLFSKYAAGSAVGFKLDSLLKLSDTRAKNNKMTLMHYLCKVEFSYVVFCYQYPLMQSLVATLDSRTCCASISLLLAYS